MPLSGASRHTSAARSGAFLKGQPKLSETITSIPGACDPLADARGPPALPIGVLLMCAALFTISAPISGLCPLGLAGEIGGSTFDRTFDTIAPGLQTSESFSRTQGPRPGALRLPAKGLLQGAGASGSRLRLDSGCVLSSLSPRGLPSVLGQGNSWQLRGAAPRPSPARRSKLLRRLSDETEQRGPERRVQPPRAAASLGFHSEWATGCGRAPLTWSQLGSRWLWAWGRDGSRVASWGDGAPLSRSLLRVWAPREESRLCWQARPSGITEGAEGSPANPPTDGCPDLVGLRSQFTL